MNGGQVGVGFGLAVLDRIVRTVFSGTIEVTQQSTDFSLNGVPYSAVSFEIKLPLSRRR